MRQYVMEMIGTFFLVLTIGLSQNALAIGAILMVMVYMGGHISGGHYNPAVTLSIWMRGKIKQEEVPFYIISQLVAGSIAAVVIWYLIGKTFVPRPGWGIDMPRAILIETILTFVLCSVILAVTTTKKLANTYVYGIAIGFALTSIVYSGGSLSGGAFNPAVAFGPILFDTIMGGSSAIHLITYSVGPLTGGALAAFAFSYLNPGEK